MNRKNHLMLPIEVRARSCALHCPDPHHPHKAMRHSMQELLAFVHGLGNFKSLILPRKGGGNFVGVFSRSSG